MDIVEFFRNSEGRWSSLKSDHHVDTTQQQSGRSTIVMELLELNDPSIVQLCDKHQLDPADLACAARVTWEGQMEGDSRTDRGAVLLAALRDREIPHRGQLLRSPGALGNAVAAGPSVSHHTPSQYLVGQTGEITIITEETNRITTERIWFESENVRLRHINIQHTDGKNRVSFCSEVRLISQPTS